MEVTPFIEKYELVITDIYNQIGKVLKSIEKRHKIKTYSKANPDKVIDAVVKLQSAQIDLMEAVGFLLQAGNAPKK